MLSEITGQCLKEIHFDYCISSPLIRAIETAEIILRESGNVIPVAFDDRIMEINFGRLERSSIRHEKVGQFLRKPIIDYKFPDGESIMELMGRTQGFLKELINKDDGRSYLVATHGCALRAMLNFMYENTNDYWHGHVPYNCCVNIIEVLNGEARLIADDKIYYDHGLVIDRYK